MLHIITFDIFFSLVIVIVLPFISKADEASFAFYDVLIETQRYRVNVRYTTKFRSFIEFIFYICKFE